MLSRSSLSIRRLVSPRRPRGSEDGNEETACESSPRVSKEESKVKGQRNPKGTREKSFRTGTKKTPQPILTIRRSGSIHRISGPLPPLPGTPHSSVNSLCSCDGRSSPRSPGAATKGRSSSSGAGGLGSPGTLCSVGSKTTNGEEGPLSSPSSCSSSVSSSPPSVTSSPNFIHGSYSPIEPSYQPSREDRYKVSTTNNNDNNNNNSKRHRHHYKNTGFSAFMLHERTASEPGAALGISHRQEQPQAQGQQGSALQPDSILDAHHRGQAATQRSPKPKPLSSDDAVVDESVNIISENVRQLIRVTDEAFKAVGEAIDEAKMASKSFSAFHSSFSPPQPREANLPRLVPFPKPRATPARKERETRSGPLLGIPVRNSSVSKTKRRKFKKSRRREQQQAQQEDQQQRRSPVSSSKPATLWGLSENISELLNVRIFQPRIEADEILTPTKLQELKRAGVISRLQANMSTETLRTIETDESQTPIEPFHLEDLPTRIGAAGVSLSIPSPIAESPPMVMETAGQPFGYGAAEVVRTNFSIPKPKQRQQQPPKQPDTEGSEKSQAQRQPQQLPADGKADNHDAMTFKDVLFPRPPLKNPLRLLPRRQLPPLPTIPEVTLSRPDGSTSDAQVEHTQQKKNKKNRKQQPPQHWPGMPLLAAEYGNFIFLNSNPFTMTMPTFCHGPIRFPKAEVCPRNPKNLVGEDSLFWTAFQMAILGGAGDYSSDSVDFTRHGDADEADDLAEWFEGFGFERGVGRLVRCNEEEDDENGAQRPEMKKHEEVNGLKKSLQDLDEASSPPQLYHGKPGSPASSVDSPSPVTTTTQEMIQIQSLPIPLAVEDPSGHSSIWIAASAYNDRNRSGSLPISKRRVDYRMRCRKGSADSGASFDSLPQSPMLELVVNRGVDGDEYVVPMGYNLGHDLGDFLRWEAENVYAAGFYGKD